MSQIACENIRFSSLFAAVDVSRGGTSLKSTIFISLDLDSAFGFGFHLRAVAQVALLLVILTEVIFCLKKLERFNSVKAN